MDYTNKVILALDNYSVPMAEEIISHWQNKVHGFKLNHNLFFKICIILLLGEFFLIDSLKFL